MVHGNHAQLSTFSVLPYLPEVGLAVAALPPSALHAERGCESGKQCTGQVRSLSSGRGAGGSILCCFKYTQSSFTVVAMQLQEDGLSRTCNLNGTWTRSWHISLDRSDTSGLTAMLAWQASWVSQSLKYIHVIGGKQKDTNQCEHTHKVTRLLYSVLAVHLHDNQMPGHGVWDP